MRKTGPTPPRAAPLLGALLLVTLPVAVMRPTTAATTATNYTADAAQSHLEFIGVQAGAEFKGEFHKFTALVSFAPDAPASNHIDVQIDLNSLDTQDKDRDKTMRSADIFDIAHTPTAHYITRSFTKTANGYAAQGSLSLRGITKDVPIEFRFTPGTASAAGSAADAKLEGTAKLKRLDFGVGQGDWKSTEWVDDAVKIHFALTLSLTP